MKQKTEIDKLWVEIESIKNLEERVILIHRDITDNKKRYKVLAEEDPYRLFELLGGDDSELLKTNWAFEYTYEEYIEEYDIDYDSVEEIKWDLEEKSIERAHETGHWYVTGTSILKGPNGIELEFEFEFCEGYLDGIIGTPYNEAAHGNHGIEFD
ncbi:MAG: hypothetical protein CFE21_06010 [Bacteroidetes bacterium B1(2017)]|nr:MAG: hypothetical protein CFE21_06010 [Bacteroidetes bacterium B1(2017)]